MRLFKTNGDVQYRLYFGTEGFVEDFPLKVKTYQSGRRNWLHVPAGFEIQTMKYNDNAFMYAWSFSFGDSVVIGRTWEEFESLYRFLNAFLGKNNSWLLVWVANLPHDFGFLCNRFEWSSVFARKENEPLYTETGRIQFREALCLAGYDNLSDLCVSFTKSKRTEKPKVKLKTFKTPLTEEEISYCVHDVAILSEWGQYCLDTFIDKNSKKKSKRIPLTATGICRQAIRYSAGKDFKKVCKDVQRLFPKNVKEYNGIFDKLYRGGFVYSSIYWNGKEVTGVVGADINSSYPAVMLQEQFPMTRFFKTFLECDGKDIIDRKLDELCIYMIVQFKNIRAKSNVSVESVDKVMFQEGLIADNRRVFSADSFIVGLTEVDYAIYKMFYEWDSIEVLSSYGSKKGFLPKYLTKPVIDAYSTKTALKRQGKQFTPDYVRAKSMLNSFYGLTVERLKFNTVKWENGWREEDLEKSYSDMIKDKYLSPYWGIWVSAYARFRLLSVVHEIDPDRNHNNVLYCDTDSIYFLVNDKNLQKISEFNGRIKEMNNNLPELCNDIGCFDWIDDGESFKFKTLGSKTYIKESASGKRVVTVAGLTTGSYLENIKDNDFFESFEKENLSGMYVAARKTLVFTKDSYEDVIEGVTMCEKSGCVYTTVPKSTLDALYRITSQYGTGTGSREHLKF